MAVFEKGMGGDETVEALNTLAEQASRVATDYKNKKFTRSTNAELISGAGEIVFARIGNMGELSASFSLAKNIKPKDRLLTIPSGFAPISPNVKIIGKVGTEVRILSLESGALMSQDTVPKGAFLAIQTSYFTNDTFPE